jgi:hypothetical protein
MKVKINARFATAEDTARALGVPLGRARKLARLVDSYSLFKRTGRSNSNAAQTAESISFSKKAKETSKNGSRPRIIAGQLKRKMAKKANTSRKNHTRAKTSKAAR